MVAFGLVYNSPVAPQFSHTTLQFPLLSKPCSLLLKTSPYSSNLRLFFVHVQSQPQSQPIGTQNSVEEAEDGVSNTVEEAADGVSNTRLLVQNVPWTCSVDDIRPLFENYGSVVDIEFSMYNKTRNRGLAFVTMSSNEEAVAALNNLESKASDCEFKIFEFEGRVLKLDWANPKKKKPSSPSQPKQLPVHNLFVANLPFQARGKDLKEFFNANGGNVVSAEVIFQDKPRRSAGYGFVSFNTEAEAQAALATFEGKEFMGRPIRVARSKRFLRQETKATIESENAQSSLSSTKQLEKLDVAEA
ncbi:28 kDa ribonucleoprotein, chloroplastic [Dorcoceras hygrometricum]|uniref:28 kDa ribonucleoprotein, chloroplastic n=1 Tax=Dorcoceras hygrometricum TaxID=472368 RepID=A0A2Z7BHX1_9LAMI|nr:28 kDa ribonucleoprotein, chloroplastic [Dorcoceras hygrometricum]